MLDIFQALVTLKTAFDSISKRWSDDEEIGKDTNTFFKDVTRKMLTKTYIELHNIDKCCYD